MFVYHTPDGRAWLYGGAQPVGVTAELAGRLISRRGATIPDAGDFTWQEHSDLWRGVFTGTLAAGVIDGFVAALREAEPDRTTPLTAENVARFLQQMLTHPG